MSKAAVAGKFMLSQASSPMAMLPPIIKLFSGHGKW
jgi:hypothetical protein